MDLVIQNVRYAVRRMGKAPFFTLVAVLSLALGIGANTAIFSLVNAVLLQDVPLERPEELVNIHSRSPDFRWGTVSFPDYRDLEERARDVFVGVSIMELGLVQVDRDDGSVDPVIAEGVTSSGHAASAGRPVRAAKSARIPSVRCRVMNRVPSRSKTTMGRTPSAWVDEMAARMSFRGEVMSGP